MGIKKLTGFAAGLSSLAASNATGELPAPGNAMLHVPEVHARAGSFVASDSGNYTLLFSKAFGEIARRNQVTFVGDDNHADSLVTMAAMEPEAVKAAAASGVKNYVVERFSHPFYTDLYDAYKKNKLSEFYKNYEANQKRYADLHTSTTSIMGVNYTTNADKGYPPLLGKKVYEDLQRAENNGQHLSEDEKLKLYFGGKKDGYGKDESNAELNFYKALKKNNMKLIAVDRFSRKLPCEIEFPEFKNFFDTELRVLGQDLANHNNPDDKNSNYYLLRVSKSKEPFGEAFLDMYDAWHETFLKQLQDRDINLFSTLSDSVGTAKTVIVWGAGHLHDENPLSSVFTQAGKSVQSVEIFKDKQHMQQVYGDYEAKERAYCPDYMYYIDEKMLIVLDKDQSLKNLAAEGHSPPAFFTLTKADPVFKQLEKKARIAHY